MNKTELIINANFLKQEAEKIFDETNILNIFSQIGRVEIIGSLRLDLMYRRDIDLLVYSEKVDKQKALKITKDLLNINRFQTVALADMQTYPADDFPRGFYWEVIVIRNNEKWKFDIWYLMPSEDYVKLVTSSISDFEQKFLEKPEKRETILSIKDAYYDGVKYKDKVKSIDIYRAVLNEGVNSITEFSDNIKSKKV